MRQCTMKNLSKIYCNNVRNYLNEEEEVGNEMK